MGRVTPGEGGIRRPHSNELTTELSYATSMRLRVSCRQPSTICSAGEFLTFRTERTRQAESSALVKIITLGERKLRKAVRDKPERERQVQDSFETLLVGADIAHDRETDSIIYSSKTYTPDFSFRSIDLAVELKLCNRSDREKEIIGEINDDIIAYKTKYRNLMFFVYDLGYIRDVDRFAQAFEACEGVIVRVIKH